MQTIICDELRSCYIMSKKIIREDGKIIKYSPNSEIILKHIESVKDNLLEEYLALSVAEYRDNYNRHLAHAMIDYVDYEVIQKHLNSDFIDKQALFNKIWKVVSNLLDNGIIYFDIHHKNILVNTKGEFKLLDLDGATIDKYILNIYHMIYNFVDLLIEVYLFYDSNKTFDFFDLFYYKVNIKKYFEQEIGEMFDLIYYKDIDVKTISVEKIIKAFDDTEKVAYLHKLIKEK